VRALALALALAAASPALPARATEPCPGCLSAGAARAALHVPAGAPLAGYGALARRLLVPDLFGRHPHAFWLRPGEGVLDPLAARALVLDAPGARVAWVAVDLIAVDRALTREVERRLAALGGRPATVILSASHTHSGPGAFLDSEVMGWLAVDRLEPAVRAAVTDAIVAAVVRADAARAPARLGIAAATAPPVTVSRLERPLDPEVVVLRVTGADGRAVAALWNYAIHGTALSPRNLRLSGDIMGEASGRVERALGVPALFVQGAVGDVSPRHHGERGVAETGAALAAAVVAAWERAAPAGPGGALRVARRRVWLPAPPAVPLRNCLRGLAPRLGLPLGGAFPRDAELVGVRLGDMASVVTIPGELQTALGLAVKGAARAAGTAALIAGVSNDYLGYFVTPEDYERPGYVTCATLYGPRGGACLVETAVGLLRSLGGDGTEPPAGTSACGAPAR
jgi:hypothetical protein